MTTLSTSLFTGGRFRRLVTERTRSRMMQNIVALYGVQVVAMIIPLVNTPYLARVLGPDTLGVVSMSQAFSMYLAIIVDYGFALSATRQLAARADDADYRAQMLAGVTGAKLLLATAGGLVLAAIACLVPSVRHHPAYVGWGLAWAVASSLNLIWYFQGTQRLRFAAVVTVACAVVAAGLNLMLVKSPDDGWMVLAILTITSVLAMSVQFARAIRDTAARKPKWPEVRGVLRDGWTMFVFRGTVSLYTSGNAFVLGLFVPVANVGFFAGAEKIARVVRQLSQPLSQALYPRISSQINSNREAARRATVTSFWVMVGMSLTAAVVLASFAPFAVRLLLGQGYEAAIPYLRVMTFIPVLVSASNVLGIQWMLPLRLDRPFNCIVIAGGMVNLLGAICLCPRLGAWGMVLSVLMSETTVTLAMLIYLARRRLLPFQWEGNQHNG